MMDSPLAEPVCYILPRPMGYLDDEEMVDRGMKPAKNYIAQPVENPEGSGWLAQWAQPGYIPEFVKDNGRITIFSTKEDADTAACIVLAHNLRRRFRPSTTGKPERYRKLDAGEFAAALAEAGLTPSFFAYLWGTSLDRVYKWIDGTEDVPHPVRIMLTVFAKYPETVDIAENVTDAVADHRQVRKEHR